MIQNTLEKYKAVEEKNTNNFCDENHDCNLHIYSKPQVGPSLTQIFVYNFINHEDILPNFSTQFIFTKCDSVSAL